MFLKGKKWVLMFLLLILSSGLPAVLAQNTPKVKEYRIERSMPKQAVACIECHKDEHPGLFADWVKSRHA